MFNLTNIIIALVVGAVAGWLAGIIMKAEGSLIRNIILGIIGGIVGDVILHLVGFGGATNIIGSIIVAVIGACVLIFLARLITKK